MARGHGGSGAQRLGGTGAQGLGGFHTLCPLKSIESSSSL